MWALLGVSSFSLALVFLVWFSTFLSPFYGLVGCGANPLCFIFCFVSVIVLPVRYFTTLALMGRVLKFGVAILHILSFSFPLQPFVGLPLSSWYIYFICLF